MNIYFDDNYPKMVFNLIKSLHELAGNNTYKIHRWDNTENEEELNESVFFVIDFQERGISIPYEKLYEEGYRTFVCKTKQTDDFSFFGLALTLFKVWPLILEKSQNNQEKFLYTFKYGGKRLNKKSKN